MTPSIESSNWPKYCLVVANDPIVKTVQKTGKEFLCSSAVITLLTGLATKYILKEKVGLGIRVGVVGCLTQYSWMIIAHKALRKYDHKQVCALSFSVPIISCLGIAAILKKKAAVKSGLLCATIGLSSGVICNIRSKKGRKTRPITLSLEEKICKVEEKLKEFSIEVKIPLKGLGRNSDGEYPSKEELLCSINKDIPRIESYFLNEENIGRREEQAESIYRALEAFTDSDELIKDLAIFTYQSGCGLVMKSLQQDSLVKEAFEDEIIYTSHENGSWSVEINTDPETLRNEIIFLVKDAEEHKNIARIKAEAEVVFEEDFPHVSVKYTALEAPQEELQEDYF